MSAKRDPTLRAQWLGQQLRELRSEASLTLQEAAQYLQRSQGTMSRFESGEYPIRRPDVLALLDLYGVFDQERRAGIMKLSTETWQKGWWDGYSDAVYDKSFADYVWLESRAREIRSFDDILVPGLLQIRRYAAATIAAAEAKASIEQLDRWVELRMMRQHVLTKDEPPRFSAVLDEGVIRRTVGGTEVMHAQLTHLVEAAARPHVELRVLPFRAGAHASPYGVFKIFSMAEPYPEVAYVDTLAGALYVEEDGIERFTQAYDWLCETALTPQESVELIAAVAEEFS